MNETKFWGMIEKAWTSAGGWKKERKALTGGTLSEDKFFELADAVNDMVAELDDALHDLEEEHLLEFDRILERKLWDIDREEIQRHTDGSDDGFLYARGFIVGMGKDFYDAVNTDPSKARVDMECEDMCFVSRQIYEDLFGEMPESEISRETASNPAGWPKG